MCMTRGDASDDLRDRASPTTSMRVSAFFTTLPAYTRRICDASTSPPISAA
eukprot:CAMPEP_0173387540 /NCGR_PEP_ID=MMETSP1356-20130122/10035_1 /TAXON_ID=77927 ORGANISM="Hemiselmis virescens, Strain PCC157" /NCGR_SAMPLE_ID=MMETSP1356 /ASSEMBLY_ACC=CAM_ASM_000847 /LENGTH=50 /DNA_ID=CAMNT_0014344189 /DNA_START=28 /DNA_END=177 /DNA_ORIENTATION=+